MTHLPEPKQPEGLAIGKVVVVGLVSLAIFAVGVTWAELILRGGEGPTKSVTESGRPEIGIVNQWPFDRDLRARTLRENDLQRLSTYGWANARERRIRVPVDHAIDAVVTEHAQEPSR